MSLGNWGRTFLRDAVGAFFGSEYLRDFTHASKTFRTNSYQNSPKFKFLYHTYFEINPQAMEYFDGGRASSGVNYNTNFGLLVKEIKLPSFKFQTQQFNQYNRKRIVQTKINYDPIDVTFHDDNGDTINSLWQAYYSYYYNDSRKASVFSGSRGAAGTGVTNYNNRNIYDGPNRVVGDNDWGYIGNTTQTHDGKKIPFFKRITVFGFNQHNFTAYTLINPVVTNFSHDTYNYNEGSGIMQNRMSLDYETVVYNYGAMSGRAPGDIVTGFGDPSNYDTELSPISVPGANATILGQGGLIDAADGFVDNLANGNLLGAVRTAGLAYNSFKNVNLTKTAGIELTSMLQNTLQNTPNNRNTLFNIPAAGSSPGPVGTAGFNAINTISQPKAVTTQTTAGIQNNG
jgi:hypothetical protein